MINPIPVGHYQDGGCEPETAGRSTHENNRLRLLNDLPLFPTGEGNERK